MRKVDKLTEGVNKFHMNDLKDKEEQKNGENFKKKPSLMTSSSIKEISDGSSVGYTIEKTIGNGTFGVVYQVKSMLFTFLFVF